MTPPQPLVGRTALVTGAGSPDGIGFACARGLRDLGAALRITATTDRVHDRAVELGGGTLGVVGDLTVEQDVLALLAVAGPVDVLVNNAGMTSVTAPDVLASVTELSAEDWDADMARNLRTAFLVTRAFLPGMVERGWGRVVNVASTTGPVNAMPDQASYAAAKAGMVGLSRAVAFVASPGSSYVTGQCLVVDGGNSVLEAR